MNFIFMKRGVLLLLTVALAGSVFVFNVARSANSDVVINEIGAYPTSTHEWVEVWNRGSEAVDLTNWTFWENNTNHRLSVTSTSDFVLAPGEYGAIAQNGDQFRRDNPWFLGSIFDSTWSSLSTAGEEIGLKDGVGNFVEVFTFLPATHFSLERKNPGLADYTAANWQEHVSGHTLGAVNSVFAGGSAATSTTTLPTAAASNGSGAATSTAETSGVPGETGGSSEVQALDTIRINEVMSDPESGAEWVELYNLGPETVNLTGSVLCDGREGACTIATPTSTIGVGEWLVVYLSSARLNNSGDSVILKTADNRVVDSVVYGTAAIPAPKKGQAVARRVDGAGLSDGASWAVTTVPTPGSANIIVAPPVPVTSGASGSGAGSSASSGNKSTAQAVKTTTTTAQSTVTGYSPVVFNEVFPNPGGVDTEAEFIELKNISATATISLAGWKIKIGSSSFVIASTTLGPGEVAAYLRPLSKLVLKNSADTVVLLNDRGQTVSVVAYDKAPEGESFNRTADGEWVWSVAPSPGRQNQVKVVDRVKIIWSIAAPKRALIGESVAFEAGESTDPRGGAFFYSWNFGDGVAVDGARVSHVFRQPGNYSVLLSATSTAGTVGEKRLSVHVGMVQTQAGGVMISELFPNPLGADTSEFIELYNASATATPIGGWVLRKGDDVFVIPEQTTINSGAFLVFKRLVTGLSLNNQGGELQLATADEDVVDEVAYPKGKEGVSYSRSPGGEWAFVEPTPGSILSADEWKAEIAAVAVKKPVAKKKTVKKAAAKTSKISTVTGIVSALPGVMGSQYFYITNDTGGVQVFQSKKKFPPLALGDEVSAKGNWHLVGGIPRVTVAKFEDMDILDTERPLVPTRVTSLTLGKEPTGSLVEVSGEITEIKSTYMYVDDGEGEVLVYFKKGAAIAYKDLKVGQEVGVTGILEKAAKGLQVLPRAMEDIEVLPVAEAASATSTAVAAVPNPYVPITIGGVTILALGALVRYRGVIFFNFFKRVAKVIVQVFRKG